MNKYKPYLWPCLLILASILTVFYIVWPSIAQIMVTRNEMGNLEERRKILADKAAILERTDDQLVRTSLLKAETALPTDKNVSGMIFGLENLAASASAKLETFSTVVGKMATDSAKPVVIEKDNKLGNQVQIISVETTFTTDFNSLKEFLRLLGSVNRLVGVNSISWKDPKANIILDVYYQPLAKTLGEIVTPVYELTQEDRVLINKVSSYPLATPQTAPLPAGKPNPFN
ncbi:MAG: hypothetical protein AAB838_02525 [Patescibacteria group bacterium]